MDHECSGEFSLVESFDIDDGQLDRLSKQDCFCLGAEFVMLRQRLLDTPTPYTDLCLAANAERIAAMAQRNGRFCEISPADDGWCTVRIGGSFRVGLAD